MIHKLSIRVTARAARAGIGGWRAGADGREELEVRVTDAPAGGAANEAVVRLLASALRLNRSDVLIVSGHASRNKRISLPLSLDEVRKRLGSGP